MLIRITRTSQSLTLALLLAVGLTPIAMAQQPTTTPSAPPVNNGEMDNFSQFLLNHPNVANQLKQNPSLINDPNFQAQHPQLQTFLKNHPGAAQQAQADPTRFVNETRAFISQGKEITRGQAAETDQFFLHHPGIEQQLQKDPSLIDNKQYLEQHPELENYLNSHPDIKREWQEHPDAFERRMGRYVEGNLQTTQRQLARTDEFLDNHPGIAAQLRKNPALIDNPQFLAQHKELQAYLNDHPETKQEWKDQPEKFYHREEQYSMSHPDKTQKSKNPQSKNQHRPK
jgi:hypothetical protein